MFKLIFAVGIVCLLAACSSLSDAGYGFDAGASAKSSTELGGPRGSSGGGP
jgi:uncharacterized lipoprotein